MVSWRPLNRKFKWLLASFLAVKWPLAFRTRFTWLVADAKFFALMFGWCKIFCIDVWLMRNGVCWCEMEIADVKLDFLMRNGDAKIFALRVGGAKLMRIFSQWELQVRSWCEIFRIENWRCEKFPSEFALRMSDAKFFALSSGDAKFFRIEFALRMADANFFALSLH